ncbi:NmrA family NAD(P)-binding protein [Acetobacter thailandicus]|uniref:NmrA family NAD(P)-binding protein n=1 Tax=Acetobacter thailandicus TaxID=1502842 RepID=UPI001BA81877|nr:NmrA family NAD(P)-binding protein [Acetobacter thailandicus]MBS1004514.1 NmrA family NAD(P)-binding protein [Acetobacter thailandicus]
MNKKIVALVGSTGQLGKLIANALLDKGAELRLLVRAESRSKVAELEARGATVVEGALGANDADALKALVDGTWAVVSAIQGGPDLIVDGQAQLLRAARNANVHRFIPSTFSLDLFKVPLGHIVTSDWRRQFADLAESERGDVEVVHILNGGFLDRSTLFGFIDVINPETGKAHVWGDGKVIEYWTTYRDTALYTAAAAVDERELPRALAVKGEALDFWGVVAAYEEASGKKLEVETLGSMDDLDALINELSSSGMDNFRKFLPLMYYRSTLNGEGALDPLYNDLFPNITPMTIGDYVRQEGL